MKKRKTYHRLSIDDRMTIQACIHDNHSITQIASRLGVNKSTISREICLHQTVKEGFVVTNCPHRSRIGLCNGCPHRYSCTKEHHYYNYVTAQEQAVSTHLSAHSKSKLLPQQILLIDGIVTEGVRLGQSLHHIYISNPKLAKICVERTIRRLCYRHELTSKPHELRRYVVYKHAYKKTPQESRLRDIRVLIGRTYKDYLDYVAKHMRLSIAHFDSVIGKITDYQAILTIIFPATNFQFGLLIQKGNSSSVRAVLKALFHRLGENLVRKIFAISLCDNGTEFSSFPDIENFVGPQSIHTFFTTPYRSTDKPQCERNHELIRYVFPKGKSFNHLTQDLVNDVFSNINSYIRKDKGDKTPYDLMKRRYGQDFLDAIGINRIPNKKVKLTQLI